jgi:RNA polymerase sigma factor (sigma-70 family)
MSKYHSNKYDTEKALEDILHRLNSTDAGPAWAEFLDLYSGLMKKTADQFEYRHDRSNDCFLYLCEKLVDNGFHRLLQYNASGNCSFRTWLGTVLFNLCVDWHRHEYGRATLLPAIAALPAFDRAVYRMTIEQGLDKETTFQTLRADFPDLTRDFLVNSIQRVYSLLTPRQRWQISVRNNRRKRSSSKRSVDMTELLPDPGARPEQEAQKQQDLERLQNAMKLLPSDQRLIVQLRFMEGLGLKKIAELTQLGDTNRAWRHLQASLEALCQNMRSKISDKKRKT